MDKALGVTNGLEGVPLLRAKSRRRAAGDAGAEPIAPDGLNHEFLPESGSDEVGESKSPGESKTTGT